MTTAAVPSACPSTPLPIRPAAHPATLTFHSDLFGSLSVPRDEVISFPAGLFGFPECRSFLLVPAVQEGLFWLQSAEYGALAFLLVDPFRHIDNYAVDLEPGDIADLEAMNAAEVAILAIVTLPRTREEACTANLQGPLALNLRTRRAKQLAISNSGFGVRHPVDLSGPPAR